MVEQVVGLKFVVEGEREAKRALKEVSDNQSKLTRNIMTGANRVKALGAEWDKANRYLKDGTLESKAHAQVQIRIAREYARLNGLIKENGALNTQKAQSELKAAQAAQDASKAEQQAIRDYANARRMANEENRRFDSERRAAAARAAQIERDAAQAAREAAAAEAAATAQRNRAQQSYNQLLAAMNPTIAMQQRMKQGHDTIRAALAAGIITRAQAAQSLRDYRNALRESNLAGSRAALGMNRLGLVTQQAGYQVGDFLVQVQSGTNVMVALGQQLTQLVGVFAMMARTTKMIAIFSGIGIIVPILTAIGAAYMRTSGAAKTLNDRLDTLKETTDNLKDSFELLQDENLEKKFGDLSPVIRSLTENMNALNDAAQLRNLLDALDALEQKANAGYLERLGLRMVDPTTILDPLGLAPSILDSLGLDPSGLEMIKTTGGIESILDERAFEKLGYQMGRQTYLDFIDAMQDAARSGDRADVISIFDQFVEDATDAGTAAAKITDEGYANAFKMYNTLLAMARVYATMNGSAKAATEEAKAAEEKAKEIAKALEKQLELEKEISEAAAERNKEFADRKISLENEIRILQLTLRYGEDSVQVQKELNLQARARLITEMMAEGQSADRIVAMLKLLKVQQDLNAEVDKASERRTNIEELESKRLESIKLYYDNLEAVAELEKENADAVRDIVKTRDDEVARLRQQMIMNQTILKYGKDSQQVAILKASDEREAYEQQMMQAGILGNNLTTVMLLYDQNVKVKNEVEAATEKAKEFADALKEAVSAMSALENFSANLDKALAVSVAKVEALKSGADAAISGQIAGMRIDLDRGMNELVASGVDRSAVEAMYGGERGRISQLQASEEERKLLEESIKKGKDKFLSRIPGIREMQAEIEKVQKDAADYQKEVDLLDSALKAGKISQQEYNSYLSQAQEVYGQASTAALQYENALLQMANTTSQAMSDAMMSIVDGTKSAKDAFSDMARIIIKKAFEMAVINPILNAIFGGVTGYVAAPSFFGAPAAAAAKGMTFQGGNVVPFANGGVVGGPATFPMSGGRTGLMGEAGPEAIMPLKRGKDGKLGVQATGGGVVINQSFNISANGDESVKRIVQQQIPNIAQATKAAVVDAKRRGGSYGRAFA